MAMNRRQLLKNMKVGAVGAALPGVSVFAMNEAMNLQDKSLFKLPELHCGVTVVGAGSAGMPAAVTAAREGAKVILPGESTTPGGAPVDVYVTYMCGAPRVGVFIDMVCELNQKYSLSVTPSSTFGQQAWDNKQHWWLPSSFAQVAYGIMKAEKNITLMCGSPVVGAAVETKSNRNRMTGVCVVRRGTLQEVSAPVTVDATGTGLLAARAGCEYFHGSDARKDFNGNIGLEKGDDGMQPHTIMHTSQHTRSGVEFPRRVFKTSALDHNQEKWMTQQTEEEFRKMDSGIYLHWGAAVECTDTTDPVLAADAHRCAMKKLEPQFETLNRAGYATHVAPKIGIRECRRIKGEYVSTVDNVLKGMVHDDKIADAWYSLDPRRINVDPRIKNSVGPYGIPYRSLTPVDTEGLLITGRIISGTRLAMSSHQVQSVCATTGEAAGTAATMAALQRTSVRNPDVCCLQNRLDERGLFDWYRHTNMNVNNKPWRK